jgi:hypothetical protein
VVWFICLDSFNAPLLAETIPERELMHYLLYVCNLPRASDKWKTQFRGKMYSSWAISRISTEWISFSTLTFAIFYLTRPDSAPALLLHFLLKGFLSTERNTSGPFTLLFSVDVENANTFHKNTEYFDTSYMILWCVTNVFAVGHCRSIASREILYNPYPLNVDAGQLQSIMFDNRYPNISSAYVRTSQGTLPHVWRPVTARYRKLT